MNLAARAGRWSARHRKTAILGWLDRLGHRRRGSPDAPDAGIVYDMRVGVVGQIAAGAEVTGRVLEVIESARRAGIRVFFTRHMLLPNEASGASALVGSAIRRHWGLSRITRRFRRSDRAPSGARSYR